MSRPEIYFTRTELDRCAALRDQTQRIEQLKKFKPCYYIPVYLGRHIYPKHDNAFYYTEEPIPGSTPNFLGMINDNEMWFSCHLDEAQAKALEAELSCNFASLRRYALSLDDELAHVAMYSRGLDLWHRNRRFCPKCGTPNQVVSSGHRMLCENGHEQFPHIEPAIIVLVSKGDRCLLGRKPSWPPNVYSTLAGFVEPGESIEDAVHREIYEESNIRITDIQYFGSQPWPFPASLMLAFNATAINEDIRLDDEMEDVRWFTREELNHWIKQGSVMISPRFSVSNNLITHFLNGA